MDYYSIDLSDCSNLNDMLKEVINKTGAKKAVYVKNLKCGLIKNEIEEKAIIVTKEQSGLDVNEIYVLGDKNEIVAKYPSSVVEDVNGNKIMVVESEETKKKYHLNIMEKVVEVCNIDDGRIYKNIIVGRQKK